VLKPTEDTTVTAVFVPRAQGNNPPLIINQTFGTLDNTGSVSHGFIELYNPNGVPVNLNDYSVQYVHGRSNATGAGLGQWNVLPLTGRTIGAYGSFLIRCKGFAGGDPRYSVEDYDMDWDMAISNRSYSVALVANQTGLSPRITPAEMWDVFDLVGATNDALTSGGDAVYNYEGTPFNGMSKQRSIRRVNFADTDNNAADFTGIDYRVKNGEQGITGEKLAEFRPRYSGDGAWGAVILTVDDIPGGINAAVANNTGSRIDFLLIAALYKDNKLQDLKEYRNCSVPEHGKGEYTIEYAAEDSDVLKIFIWDDKRFMNPFVKAFVRELQK